MEKNVTRRQLKFALPANLFKKEFIEIYVEKGLGVKAWQVSEYFNLKHRDSENYSMFQALDNAVFLCEKVNDEIHFVGTY